MRWATRVWWRAIAGNLFFVLGFLFAFSYGISADFSVLVLAIIFLAMALQASEALQLAKKPPWRRRRRRRAAEETAKP